jgi:hypothetical protein
MKRALLIFALILGATALADSDSDSDTPKKKVKYNKTQEVNFDETGIDGVVHSPDGAYLLQTRGVKFTPLYKVDQQMEKGILDSINYLK